MVNINHICVLSLHIIILVSDDRPYKGCRCIENSVMFIFNRNKAALYWEDFLESDLIFFSKEMKCSSEIQSHIKNACLKRSVLYYKNNTMIELWF